MSYVQGTTVRTWAEFTDEATDEPYVPDEIVVTIEQPDGTITTQTKSGGDVTADATITNRFYALVDTSPAYGTWKVQFETPDTDRASVERKTLTVRKRITA